MMDHDLHVMVLDSDVELLSPLYRLLSNRGCRVATYSSPWGAFDYAEEETPDAILTSLDFPGFYGMEIVRRLRQASSDSRIIVLSPEDRLVSPEEVRDAGGDAKVSKSLLGEQLLPLFRN